MAVFFTYAHRRKDGLWDVFHSVTDKTPQDVLKTVVDGTNQSFYSEYLVFDESTNEEVVWRKTEDPPRDKAIARHESVYWAGNYEEAVNAVDGR